MSTETMGPWARRWAVRWYHMCRRPRAIRQRIPRVVWSGDYGISAIARRASVVALQQRDSEEAITAFTAYKLGAGSDPESRARAFPVDKLPPWVQPGEYYNAEADEFVIYNAGNITLRLLRMVLGGWYYGVSPPRGPYAPGRSW